MIRRNVFNIIATLALVLTLLMGFVGWSAIDRLERIDHRLDNIQSELTMIQSPTYQDRVFQERMSRLLDLVRERQELALAHSE